MTSWSLTRYQIWNVYRSISSFLIEFSRHIFRNLTQSFRTLRTHSCDLMGYSGKWKLNVQLRCGASPLLGPFLGEWKISRSSFYGDWKVAPRGPSIRLQLYHSFIYLYLSNYSLNITEFGIVRKMNKLCSFEQFSFWI